MKEQVMPTLCMHAWYMPYACIGGVCLFIHACMHGVYGAKRYVYGGPPKF